MELPKPVASDSKSGSAHTEPFVGSDSRRFSYFEPRGRRASEYENVTVDVQPDPKRYLLQDWIISFGDGAPAFHDCWTQARSSDWHKFRSADQEWERVHYQRQSATVGMLGAVIANGRKSGAPQRFSKAWVGVLQEHIGAYKHAEFGLGAALMRAQRRGRTQMINNTFLTNASYKLRFAQDLTLYLGELSLDIDGVDLDAGKRHWLGDPVWQGARLAVEAIMAATDYLEQYFAINVIFEPLLGELIRGRFVMEAAPAQNDYIAPVIASAAQADYERNLANAVELFAMLARDPQYGVGNRRLFQSWAELHGTLALDAARPLTALWPQAGAQPGRFREAVESTDIKLRSIASEIGFDAGFLAAGKAFSDRTPSSGQST